jgi:hypothetical protein
VGVPPVPLPHCLSSPRRGTLSNVLSVSTLGGVVPLAQCPVHGTVPGFVGGGGPVACSHTLGGAMLDDGDDFEDEDEDEDEDDFEDDDDS